MAVRYDKKFMREITRVTSNYNRKITRLTKQGVSNLPSKFTKSDLSDLKQFSGSRTDVRRRLKNLESFTAKGGELILPDKGIPKYQYENIKRYQRLLSYQTTKKLERFENTKPVHNNVEGIFTFAELGTQDYLNVLAKRELLSKDITDMTTKEREDYLSKLMMNTRKVDLDIWKTNYMAILQDTALSFDWDDEKLEVLVGKLQMLTPEQFDDLLFKNENFKDIIYKYKALDNLGGQAFRKVQDDVLDNLDTIYEDIDDILKEYVEASNG